MFVTYFLHSYLLDPYNVNMLVCLQDWYRWHWTFNIDNSLNWIHSRNILNLNTFDNLRVIHLTKLEMCFQVSTIFDIEFSATVLTKINY